MKSIFHVTVERKYQKSFSFDGEKYTNIILEYFERTFQVLVMLKMEIVSLEKIIFNDTRILTIITIFSFLSDKIWMMIVLIILFGTFKIKCFIS